MRKKINNRFWLVLVALMATTAGTAFSQQQTNDYVIIMFEDSYKVSQHNKRIYYWIISIDSISSYDDNLSKLFLSGFSKNDLEACCKGEAIDPSLVVKNTSYNFSPNYFEGINNLEDIIENYKKKLQVIKKKWSGGQRETTIIYAIPVQGQFCFSDYHLIGQERASYYGRVSLPFSDFSYASEFWESDKAKFILSRDFSKVDFDIIP